MAKKLYVGNLSYDTTEDDLIELFTQFGEVLSAQIILDRDTNRSKGFGFVEMADPAGAEAAAEVLNGQDYKGRNLAVNEARPRESRDSRYGGETRYRESRGMGSIGGGGYSGGGSSSGNSGGGGFESKSPVSGQGAYGTGDSQFPSANASNKERVELLINADFNTFTTTDEKKIIEAIKKLLNNPAAIRVVSRRPGSVRLTLEMTPEQAAQLLQLTDAEDLSELGIVGVTRVSNSKSRAGVLFENSSGSNTLGNKTNGKIFIGHGRSMAWRDLKDFIQDRLHLEWDEFNREASEGMTIKERLQQMLNDANFALIIMTAEDQDHDSKFHARENVVHEAGLFQAKLGFDRAIILIEEGCSEFSNINGLIQLRFPAGNIMAVSERIRRILEREGIVSQTRDMQRKQQ